MCYYWALLGADSLELLVSSLEEILEVLVQSELAELLALQDPLRAGQVAGDIGSWITTQSVSQSVNFDKSSGDFSSLDRDQVPEPR